MATHLQGVTDMIPGIMPWQPDLDFYRTALIHKEQQFDQGYQKVNSIYNSVFNSPLTRDTNINRRDEYFQSINQQLQKAAKLDLSRPENVESARKIFQPLINDRYLQKDIAFTHQYMGSIQRANALKDCIGPNCPEQYWDEGVQELEYRRLDFANASDDESLRFDNPKYTPFKNIYKEALEYAKTMGFSQENITFSADGRYQIKTTNGAASIPSFENMLISSFASDPQSQAVTATQAYLMRKNYIAENASVFGGEEQAEQEYIRKILNEVGGQTEQKDREIQEGKTVLNGKAKIVSQNAPDLTPNQLFPENIWDLTKDYQNQLQILDGAGKVIERQQSILDAKLLDPNNMSNLRRRVDAAVSNSVLYGTLSSAAQDYSMLTQKIDIKADEYSLADYNHSLAKQLAKYKEDLKNPPMPEGSFVGVLGDGVITPGNSISNASDMNVDDLMVEGFAEASGNAIGAGTSIARETFLTLNQAYQSFKNAGQYEQAEAVKNEIKNMFGIEPNVEYEQTSRADKLPILAESIYEYYHSLPSDKREDFLESGWFSEVKDLGNFDGSKSEFIRGIQNISASTSRSLFGQKNQVADLQDMIRNFDEKGSDWDSTGIMRTFAYSLDSDEMQKISQIYHQKVSGQRIKSAKGWVAENANGELEFLEKYWNNSENLTIPANGGSSPTNPLTVINRAKDFWNTQEARALVGNDLLLVDKKANIDRAYQSFNTALQVREAYAKAQKQNNRNVVDYLSTGTGGQGTTEYWKDFGKYFLNNNGDVRSREEFEQVMLTDPDTRTRYAEYLAKFPQAGTGPGAIMGVFRKSPESVVREMYDTLKDEFYGAYREGLPNMADTEILTPYRTGGGGMVFADGLTRMYEPKVTSSPATQLFYNFAQTDLAAMSDNPSVTYYKGDMGTITPGETDSDNDPLLRAATSQLVLDVIKSFGDKKANRMGVTYTTYDIADGTYDRQGITLTFDQAAIKSLKDLSKDDVQAAYYQVFGNGENSITMTFPKGQFAQQLFESTNTPNLSKVINMSGKKGIGIYDDKYGGRIHAKRQGSGYVIERNIAQIVQKGDRLVSQYSPTDAIYFDGNVDLNHAILQLKQSLVENARRNQEFLVNTPLDGTTE